FQAVIAVHGFNYVSGQVNNRHQGMLTGEYMAGRKRYDSGSRPSGAQRRYRGRSQGSIRKLWVFNICKEAQVERAAGILIAAVHDLDRYLNIFVFGGSQGGN